MYCKKCGSYSDRETSYCAKCGAPMGDRTGSIKKQKEDSTKRIMVLLCATVVVLAGALLFVLGRQSGQSQQSSNKEVQEAGTWEDSENPPVPEEKNALYGTWKDVDGKVTFTFYEDGTIRISGGTGLLGANLFTFKEVGDHTLLLMVDSIDESLDVLNMSMQYTITDEVMVVEIGDQAFQLTRAK